MEKKLNVKRDGAILFCFAYIPDRFNYIRVGRIQFIYITIDVMHYTTLGSKLEYLAPPGQFFMGAKLFIGTL